MVSFWVGAISPSTSFSSSSGLVWLELAEELLELEFLSWPDSTRLSSSDPSRPAALKDDDSDTESCCSGLDRSGSPIGKSSS